MKKEYFEDLNYDAQLAENDEVDDICNVNNEFNKKREMLEKTKIVKQTWSIREIYQKIIKEDLILNPDYQRNVVWQKSKQTSFIESLFMEIMIPPIYVVEVPSDNILDPKKYEVVDGKQRLTTIKHFINNELILDKKHLEYYSDLYGGKNFSTIYSEYSEKANQVLSSILDIYVITSNSPEETKYDIFSRLNKGSEPLKVNEIRKAIYRSSLSKCIDKFVDEQTGKEANINSKNEYTEIFSENNIKRFEDYGRFYRSIAFYIKSNTVSKEVEGYNSRPREMINNVLQLFQKKEINLDKKDIVLILTRTLELLKLLKNDEYKDYIIDACIPYIITDWKFISENINLIKNDNEIKQTFMKSPATTSNVNKRLAQLDKILKGSKNG